MSINGAIGTAEAMRNEILKLRFSSKSHALFGHSYEVDITIFVNFQTVLNAEMDKVLVNGTTYSSKLLHGCTFVGINLSFFGHVLPKELMMQHIRQAVSSVETIK